MQEEINNQEPVDKSSTETNSGEEYFLKFLNGDLEEENQDTEEDQESEVEETGDEAEKIKARQEELIAKNESEGLSDEEYEEAVKLGLIEAEEGSEEKKEEKPEEEKTYEPPSYVEELKQIYPEQDLSTPDQVNDAIYAMIADLKASNEADTALAEAVNSNPEFASLLEAVIKKGMPLTQALLEAGVDPKEIIPKPGEDGYDTYIIAQNEKKKKALETQRFVRERSDNLAKSQIEVRRFFVENKIKQEDQKSIGEKLDAYFGNIMTGIVPTDLIKMIYDGMTKESAVATARAQGELKGRNENIILKKRNFKKGDGMKRLIRKSDSSIVDKQKQTYADDGSEAFMKFLKG